LELAVGVGQQGVKRRDGAVGVKERGRFERRGTDYAASKHAGAGAKTAVLR
jgi:hypothetical protein